MMNKILSAAAILVFASSAAFAAAGQPHGKGSAAHRSTQPAALVCPVTGTRIASVKAAVGHSTFRGKTYYFCCAECKPRFDKNPQHFVTDSAHGKFEKM